MPKWRDEVVSAVDAWQRAVGRTDPEWKTIGRLHPERDVGWYSVDVRSGRERIDQFNELNVVDADTSADVPCRVTNAVQDGEVLRVEVHGAVADQSLALQRLVLPPAYLLASLSDRLAALDEPGLAAVLARGELTKAPTRNASAPEDLNDEQRAAYAACMAPGLRMVWGPPGTGKTRVLVSAISDLVLAGNRVLLVSSTNIAVDNALVGVAAAPHEAGEFVRVGVPHLPEVAEDTTICLDSLVTARAAELEREIERCERALGPLLAERAELRRRTEQLEPFDPDAYARAYTRIDNEGALTAARARLREAREAYREPQRAVDDAEQRLAAARAHRDAATAAEAHIRSAEKRQETLSTYLFGIGPYEHRLAELQKWRGDLSERTSALDGSARNPISRGLQRRRLATYGRSLDKQIADAEENLRDARQRYRTARARLQPEIDDALAKAAPIDRAEITRRSDAVDAARHARDAAAQAAREPQQRVREAQHALDRAEQLPQPSAADRELVASATSAGYPKLHAELTRLRARVDGHADERVRLESHYRRLSADLDAFRHDAEREIIGAAKLVATTLAMFRLRDVVYEGPYDVVLVDEVGASSLPEVLLAVAQARSTAVLLGDFRQLGPIVSDAPRRPDVRRWIVPDCFQAVGITTAHDAITHPGCVVLTAQYRFGDAIMALANAVAYDGRLRAGTTRSRDSGEIVLIDTDRLGDLGTIRRRPKMLAGWWPAGSLLARALAEHHRSDGQTVGIAAPHSAQSDATLEAIRDLEGRAPRAGTEVGTVHRLQGREFDVAVFDLMEDRNLAVRGWISQACEGAGDFKRNGLRLFNVGVTRPRDRLYLIGSRSAIASHRAGPVLQELRRLIETDRIQVLDGARLLGMTPEVITAIEDPLYAELATAFSRFVRVASIDDEHTFFDTMRRYVSSARGSVWIWAPWVGARTRTVLPILEQAAQHAR